MTDIRKQTDEEIKASITELLDGEVRIVRANRHDRTSPVLVITVTRSEPVEFMKLTELAGICMTPSIRITGDAVREGDGFDEMFARLVLRISWDEPLAVEDPS